MAVSGRRKSIAFFITLGACLVALAIALNVGWILLNAREIALLVFGIIFFLLIITGVVLNTTFLIREIRRNEQHDAFINAVTHELKTPMTTISGHTQLLLRRLSRIQELSSEMAVIRTSLESIDGQTRRLNALVNELLELSCIRAGKIDMHAEKCNLRDICCQVVEQQHNLTDRRITLNAPTVSILLEADCARLSQVMFNLVDNAVKYSSPESQVEVYLSQDEEVARMEVRDSGSGIAEDEQQHLFEPFYRGTHMQTTPLSGMGLGLTICKEIVDRHGGRIWCEPRENSGSSFFVELPVH